MCYRYLALCLWIATNFTYASDLKVLQNLFIFGADLSRITEGMLDALAESGAEGFELPGTSAKLVDCERMGAYFARKEKEGKHFDRGLNVAALLSEDPASLNEAARQAGIAYLKSKVDCAVAMGAKVVAGPLVMPWGGFYKTDSTNVLHDEFLDPKLRASIDSIREVADYAAVRGVSLALEPLHRHEMHGLNTINEAAKYIFQVGRKNFGLCMDISHEVIDGAGPKNYSELVHKLKRHGYFIYAQVSAPSRGDVEHSWIPWEQYLGLIKDIGLCSVTIEIMEAVPPFTGPDGMGIRIARRPFYGNDDNEKDTDIVKRA
jgi:sugar phosphate isomerase/epimerase